MRIAFWLLASVLFVYPASFSQSVLTPAGNQRSSPTDLPLSRRTFKPKIQLPAAMKIAENYIAEEHIDISNRWLSEATFILYGDRAESDQDQAPCWRFVWLRDDGLIGDYVDVLVSMEGKAFRVPTM
jgi:hypothetical protein